MGQCGIFALVSKSVSGVVVCVGSGGIRTACASSGRSGRHVNVYTNHGVW